MENYYWTCPECGKTTIESTTGSYGFGDDVECPWCGRVSRVTNLEIDLSVKATIRKASPTKLEELKALKTESKLKMDVK